MNIVFDDGLELDSLHREVFSALLPIENAPLQLNQSTGKTDGTSHSDEGYVFLTGLPVDVLKYHSVFFEEHKDAPQWFFILLSKTDHGVTLLKNAARKYDLKNCTVFHAGNLDQFRLAVEKISAARRIIKGKALLLSRHVTGWTSDLAKLLYEDESKYEIMDSVHMGETDAESLLLCGENVRDFLDIQLPEHMEPYFVFRFRGELQLYLDNRLLTDALARHYHMTTERIASRFFFVDTESEKWISSGHKTSGQDAVDDGILLWDRFGLPVSRKAYTSANIEKNLGDIHRDMERLRALLG